MKCLMSYDPVYDAAGYDSFRGTQEKAVAAALTGMATSTAFLLFDYPKPSWLGPK